MTAQPCSQWWAVVTVLSGVHICIHEKTMLFGAPETRIPTNYITCSIGSPGGTPACMSHRRLLVRRHLLRTLPRSAVLVDAGCSFYNIPPTRAEGFLPPLSVWPICCLISNFFLLDPLLLSPLFRSPPLPAICLQPPVF